jgi:hypothetical protein
MPAKWALPFSQRMTAFAAWFFLSKQIDMQATRIRRNFRHTRSQICEDIGYRFNLTERQVRRVIDGKDWLPERGYDGLFGDPETSALLAALDDAQGHVLYGDSWTPKEREFLWQSLIQRIMNVRKERIMTDTAYEIAEGSMRDVSHAIYTLTGLAANLQRVLAQAKRPAGFKVDWGAMQEEIDEARLSGQAGVERAPNLATDVPVAHQIRLFAQSRDGEFFKADAEGQISPVLLARKSDNIVSSALNSMKRRGELRAGSVPDSYIWVPEEERPAQAPRPA